jgi:hypothetical protein
MHRRGVLGLKSMTASVRAIAKVTIGERSDERPLGGKRSLG